MKSREQRFYGTGNHTLVEGDGRQRRVWRVYCSNCGGDAHVGSSKGFLPPDVVIKKFRQKGWLIAATEFRDVCPACKDAVVIPKPAPKPVVVASPPPPAEPPPPPPQFTCEPEPPPPPDQLDLLVAEIDEARSYASTLESMIRTRNREVGRLEDANRELQDANSKLYEEIHDRLKYTVGDPSEFVRHVHSLLVSGEPTLARQKIEQTYPKWPWPQPAVKKVGSIKKPKMPEDAGYDEWILEQQRVARP